MKTIGKIKNVVYLFIRQKATHHWWYEISAQTNKVLLFLVNIILYLASYIVTGIKDIYFSWFVTYSLFLFCFCCFISNLITRTDNLRIEDTKAIDEWKRTENELKRVETCGNEWKTDWNRRNEWKWKETSRNGWKQVEMTKKDYKRIERQSRALRDKKQS